MRTIVFLISLVSLTLLSVSDSANAGESSEMQPLKSKWALVVGISQFKYPGNNLHFADKDALDFASYLEREAGFLPDHIKVLTNSQATRENILENLGDSWLPTVVGPDDLVVLFLSSHGSEARQDIIGVNYVIPYDLDPRRPYATAIPTQDLARIIRSKLRCNRILVVLDTCFSGAAGSQASYLAKGVDADEIARGTGQLVICSSRADQTSAEASGYNHGLFTYFLLEGLRQNNNQSTLREAFDYCKQNVQQVSSKSQTPVMSEQWNAGALKLSTPSGAMAPAPPKLASSETPPTASTAQASPSHKPRTIMDMTHGNEVWSDLFSTGEKEHGKGHFVQAEEDFRLAIAEAEKFGDNDTRLATTLNSLALLLDETSRPEQAESVMQRSVAVYKAALGEKHPCMASVIANLAQIKYDREHYSEAETLLKQALGILEKKYGSDDPALSYTLRKLGEVYIIEGDQTKADELLGRALKVSRAHGADPVNEALALHAVGLLNENKHDYKQAESNYKEALAILSKRFPEEHPLVATESTCLGKIYFRAGKYTEAETLLKRAIDIYRQKQSSHYASTVTDLGSIYLSTGEARKAEELYKEAIGEEERIFGQDSCLLATTLSCLGSLYYDLRNLKEAEAPLRRALSIQEKHCQYDAQTRAYTMEQLANVLAAKKAPEAKAEAGQLYKQALPMCKDKDSAQYATILAHYATVCGEQGDTEKAKTLFQEAMQIVDKPTLSQKSECAHVLNQYGLFLAAQKRHAEAEPIYKRVLEIDRKLYPEDSVEIGIAMVNLGASCTNNGKLELAEPLFKQSLDIFRKKLGDQSIYVASTLKHYAKLDRKLGREAEATQMEAEAEKIRSRSK